MANNGLPSVTLGLHAEGWKAVTLRAGLSTDAEQAAALKLSRPHVNRVRNGRKAPGPEFIAAALRAFPGARFEEMFIVVTRAAA